MQRRSAIAVAGAVTGILIAGSVASVAVINAASSSTSTDEAPIVAASVIEPASVPSVEPEPSLDQAPLPAIVVPDPSEPTGRSEQRTVADSMDPAPQAISRSQAQQAAVGATPGKVLGTARVERSGYDAFAVQIERPDGSVVTGYVEATSGVVFDWVVDKEAPAPAATYDDEYDDDDYEDEHDDEHETSTTRITRMTTMTKHATSAAPAKARARQGAADKIWAVGLAGITCVGLVGTMGVRLAQEAAAGTNVPESVSAPSGEPTDTASVATSTGLTEQQLDDYARALEQERLRLEAYHAQLLDAAAKLQRSGDTASQSENVIPASASSAKKKPKPLPKPAAAPQVAKPQAQTRGS